MMGLGSCDVIRWPRLAVSPRPRVGSSRLARDPIDHRNATVVAEREAYPPREGQHDDVRRLRRGYLAERLEQFQNAKHKATVAGALRRASAAFGDLNVAVIDAPMVIKFLKPIWNKTPETGSRMRGRIEKVLDWARVHRFRDGDNPARWQGHLEHVFQQARPATTRPCRSLRFRPSWPGCASVTACRPRRWSF